MVAYGALAPDELERPSPRNESSEVLVTTTYSIVQHDVALRIDWHFSRFESGGDLGLLINGTRILQEYPVTEYEEKGVQTEISVTGYGEKGVQTEIRDADAVPSTMPNVHENELSAHSLGQATRMTRKRKRDLADRDDGKILKEKDDEENVAVPKVLDKRSRRGTRGFGFSYNG
ncbi:hypothetical protein HWV62_26009 [Athelia sp. TMB]|nr:hypothetical protein HWV62_26009 [Athelia sp. TMB]